MKQYKVNPQIGSVKHSISFHDGIKTHKDGSDFWEIRIFKNVMEKAKFEDRLIINGYKQNTP